MSESVATPIVTSTKIARTRAAERMRRCRQHRRDGLRCYKLKLGFRARRKPAEFNDN